MSEDSQVKISRRSCLSCRKVESKDKLLRFVINAGSILTLDPNNALPGRGAYLHREPSCLGLDVFRITGPRSASAGLQIVKPGPWEKALRVESGTLDPKQISEALREARAFVEAELSKR